MVKQLANLLAPIDECLFRDAQMHSKQGHYQGFVTGATEVIYSDSGRLPSDALQQITA